MKANAFFSIAFLAFAATDITGMVVIGFKFTLLIYLIMSLILTWTFLTVDDQYGRTVWGEIKRYRSRRRHRKQASKHKRRQEKILEFKYKPLNR